MKIYRYYLPSCHLYWKKEKEDEINNENVMTKQSYNSKHFVELEFPIYFRCVQKQQIQ